MIVVDASVAVKWFVVENGDQAARDLLAGREPLIGPDLVLYETLNVLRRKYKRGEIRLLQWQQAAEELVGFFDQLVSAPTLVAHAVSLASSLDHDVYDCVYLACALQRGAILITADERFATKAAANGFQGSVRLLQ